jgi:hypothetical protein
MTEYFEWLDRFMARARHQKALAMRNAVNYSRWVTRYYDREECPDIRTDAERARYAAMMRRRTLTPLRIVP